jgi:uncharacterized protein (DUF433 family)
MTAAATSALIVCTPGTVGGAPRIDGTRLRVADIVLVQRYQELTAEQIARHYDTPLTLTQVEAALQYYADHRQEIDDYIGAEEMLHDAMAAQDAARRAANGERKRA